MVAEPRTWILTGSPENHAATAEHGFSDRTKLWPGKPGRPDAYPWRFPTEPELVLEEADWVPAEGLAGELEHVRKWPAQHWKLAFQGQIRAVSDADAQVLLDRLRSSARAAA